MSIRKRQKIASIRGARESISDFVDMLNRHSRWKASDKTVWLRATGFIFPQFRKLHSRNFKGRQVSDNIRGVMFYSSCSLFLRQDRTSWWNLTEMFQHPGV